MICGKECGNFFAVDEFSGDLDRDLLCVLESEEQVRKLTPDLEKAMKLDGLLLCVTAKGEEYDCVSRVFAPKCNTPEDPVTGSAHCMIAPYWSDRLGKDALVCYQASARAGILYADVKEDRVTIAGKAALFSVGEIYV